MEPQWREIRDEAGVLLGVADPELDAQEARLEAVRAEPKPAITIAAGDGDLAALRRELDLGVPVDLADARKSTPLQVACGAKDVSAEDRFACAKLLVSSGTYLDAVDAGYLDDPLSEGDWPMHLTPLIEAVCRRDLKLVKMLLSAGADANVQLVLPPLAAVSGPLEGSALGRALDEYYTVAHVDPGTPEEKRLCLSVVDALVKAGADANAWREQRYGTPVSPIEVAINRGDHRLWSILFRGGATIPTDDEWAAEWLEDYTRHRAHPYLRKIETAGGWKAYEKAHRTKILATFVPKFTHLVPKELVPLIVEFSFHVGFY